MHKRCEIGLSRFLHDVHRIRLRRGTRIPVRVLDNGRLQVGNLVLQRALNPASVGC